MELFHEKAKDAVINKEYPAHLVEFDPPKFLKILGSTFSPAAELLKAWNKAGNLLSVIIDGAVDAWSELARLINDTFGTGDGGFELVGEIPLGGAGTFDRTWTNRTDRTDRTDRNDVTDAIVFCSYDTTKFPIRNKLLINEVAWM